MQSWKNTLYFLYAGWLYMENENYLRTLKEGLRIELKESGKKIPDSLYDTYSSFSNTEGGTIYLGIKEGKLNTIVGISNPEEQKKALISTLHSKKTSYCSISDEDVQIIDVNGKKIIRFVVKEAPLGAKPVYIDGNLSKSYQRIGDGDFLMSEDEIASLLLRKKGTGFDMLPNYLDLDETNIDKESLGEFRKEVDEANPNNFFRDLNDHDFLYRIGALTKANGKEVLKNGAVLFFGQQSDISQICPNYFLDYQENFSGKTRWDNRIASDDYSFNANLFNFFRLVSSNLIQRLPKPFNAKDGVANMNGKDVKRSVIEGMVNAITNCDFSSLPGIVIKRTYDNVAFINSGDIPVGIKQAIEGGVTNPLNKNIMNYFRLLQVSDRAGSGIPSIFEMCRSYGFLKPILAVESNPKRTTLIIHFAQLNQKTPHYTEKMEILSYLNAHPEGASTEELSKQIGMKKSSTSTIVTELLLTNLVKTNGKKTKGKRYFISDNGE